MMDDFRCQVRPELHNGGHVHPHIRTRELSHYLYCDRIVGALAYRADMERLWPEQAGEQCPYKVVTTVPREDGGEPLVPYDLPPEVLACWSADQVTVSATMTASGPSRAVAALDALAPELAGASRASVTACEEVADSGASVRVSGR
jgi:hypothetical protein